MKIGIQLCFEEGDSIETDAAEVTLADGAKITLTHAVSQLVAALPISIIDVAAPAQAEGGAA